MAGRPNTYPYTLFLPIPIFLMPTSLRFPSYDRTEQTMIALDLAKSYPILSTFLIVLLTVVLKWMMDTQSER